MLVLYVDFPGDRIRVPSRALLYGTYYSSPLVEVREGQHRQPVRDAEDDEARWS